MFTWSFSPGDKCFPKISLKVKGEITRWHKHFPSVPSAVIHIHCAFCLELLQGKNLSAGGEMSGGNERNPASALRCLQASGGDDEEP